MMRALALFGQFVLVALCLSEFMRRCGGTGTRVYLVPRRQLGLPPDPAWPLPRPARR
jgi:hypothetical protein